MASLTKGELTRDRIIEAGLRCFGRRGFQSATLDEIAKLSKTQRPAIIKYFGSKNGLLSACVMKILDRVGNELNEAEKSCRTAVEVLDLQFEKNLELAASRPGEVQVVMLFYTLAAHEKDLKIDFERAISRIRIRYEAIVQRVAKDKSLKLEMSALEIGRMLHQFIIGAVVLLLASKDSIHEHDVLRQQWSLLVLRLIGRTNVHD
jgi:AcrR family transcriptional regulator